MARVGCSKGSLDLIWVARYLMYRNFNNPGGAYHFSALLGSDLIYFLSATNLLARMCVRASPILHFFGHGRIGSFPCLCMKA